MKEFWAAIGIVNDAVGFIGLITTFLFGLGLKHFIFKFRQWWYRFKHGQKINLGYVMILGNKGTETSVRKYLNDNPMLSQILDDAICLVETPEAFTPDNMKKYIDNFVVLREATKKHSQQDVLHLFMQTPVVVGAAVGAYLFNKGDVYLYHYQGSSYVCYGRLNTQYMI
jgi:hypothetical protein